MTTKQKIEKIIKSITCYNYHAMPGKDEQFLVEKAIDQLYALIQEERKEIKGTIIDKSFDDPSYGTVIRLRDILQELEQE